MLQQEVEKALQEKRPVPPMGFAERSDAQVLRLTSEEKAGRRIPRAAVVLCTLLLVLGITTGLAATVEGINERLHAYWPELAELLMPVDADCESLGIRMEVESAVVKDNKVMILYSMQDLEGDRLNGFTEAGIDRTAFPLDDTKGYTADAGTVLLSWDAETRKAMYATEIEYNRPVGSRDCQVPLRVPALVLRQVQVTDLRPLLEQYGESAAFMPASQAAVRECGTPDGEPVLQVPDSLKVLDYTRNTETPIGDHAALSGIGWADDGTLHVQLHYIDNGLVWVKENEDAYYPVSGHVLMQLANGVSPLAVGREKLPGGICGVNLGGGEDGPEWQEYIFPCDPADVQSGRLEAQITLNSTVEVLEGDWEVKVPLSRIRYE